MFDGFIKTAKMNIKILYIIYFFVALGVCIAVFPEGFNAIVLSGLISIPSIFILRKGGDKAEDLLKIFLIAIILRTLASTAIHFFQLANFFALDWNLYDQLGYELSNYWNGSAPLSYEVQERVLSFRNSSWGIFFLVSAVYSLVGRNLLAAQLVIASIGAATAPVAYLCAYQIYNNRRVALLSGYIVALAPSLVLWSSLVLKDGPIIFFLVLTMYASVKLQEKLDYKFVIVLLLSLIGVMSMRNYIFYIVTVAVAGGFLIGQKNTVRSIVSRTIVVVFVGVSLGYLGILNNAQYTVESMTSLENIQVSRKSLATEAASGFGEDYDVSTVQGSLAVLPVGIAYLMLSPLPWQFTSTLSLMTLPEMLVWYLTIPLLVTGISYSIRQRLRKCISILVFTLMLTIGYSIMQGNVGTAYRQRAQIQVFLFIFIAVGWSLIQERKENRRIMRQNKEWQLNRRIQVSKTGV